MRTAHSPLRVADTAHPGGAVRPARTRRGQRRIASLSSRLASGLLAGACALVFTGAAPAAAGGDGLGGIDVVQVQGLLDPANASLLKGAVRDAEEAGSTLLVLQIDSTGALDIDVEALVATIRDAQVPVAAWVGPPGAVAKGAATLLAAAADVLAVAPGTVLGPAAPVSLDDPSGWEEEAVVGLLDYLQSDSGREASSASGLVSGGLDSGEAVESGVVDLGAPSVGELIVSLDGRTVETPGGAVELSTATVVGEGQERRRSPNQEVRFAELDIGGQVSHTLATPWVPYLLFVAGAILIVFEFFSLGVGLAGVVGAVAVAMAFAGFGHLPRAAVGALPAGPRGLRLRRRPAGRPPRPLHGRRHGGTPRGSLALYGGSARLDPAWWIPLLVCASVVALMLTGMPGMVRARFSAPSIGRRGLVGETGAAEGDLDPEGLVRVRGALWRARSHGSVPIGAGTAVRVEDADGFILEVEASSPPR
ncbi:MAG: hypothetical protein M5T61_05485 [Acidimicrobiia bacterium]|nr:hypothetical protein [Acidimicrobiia bacterium]